MTAEPVHMPIARRNTTVGEENRDLVQRLGAEGPEVPLHVHVTEVRFWVPFLRVDEHLELVGIAHKEDGRVVPDEIPVPLVRIELERKPAYVALGVCRAALARDGRESREHGRRLADAREERGPAVARDVLRHREGAIRAGPLGVHGTLGNPLAVELLHLLDELDILHQHGATGAGGQRLLDTDRGAVDGREYGRFLHVAEASGSAYSCPR